MNTAIKAMPYSEKRETAGEARKVILSAVSAFFVGLLPGLSVEAAQVDVTNQNGTVPNQLLNSNGGLSSDEFAVGEGGGVSVWLRSRNLGDQGPIARSGNLFKIRADEGGSGDEFYIDFQFTPADGATVEDNYFVKLELDNDPTAAVNFMGGLNEFAGFVFDSDSDDELLDSGRSGTSETERSWDDGDSVVIDDTTVRGGSPVEFGLSSGEEGTLPDYVLVNSWAAEWDFPNFSLLGDDFGGAPGPGLYDVRLSAFESTDGEVGNQLASVQITTQIGEVPLPSGLIVAITGLAGLFAARYRIARR